MEDRAVVVTKNGMVKLNAKFKEMKYIPFAMVRFLVTYVGLASVTTDFRKNSFLRRNSSCIFSADSVTI